jgi:NAD(P)-dependent dehydrogenase (short-subunit alcohol dehydrogenase family)
MTTTESTTSRSVVVVGAGPGMGAAIARRFAREGFRVGLLSRRLSTLDPLVEEFVSLGVEVHAAAGDVSYAESLRTGMAELTSALGIPDVLVYNVSVPAPGRVSMLDPVQFLASMATNAGGFITTVQTVLQAMRERGSGTILLTGSGAALNPWPDGSAVSAGKAAQRNLLHSLAKEVSGDGVHACTVTIKGLVLPGTAFDPDLIAEEFWTLHCQPPGEWEWERAYDPTPDD